MTAITLNLLAEEQLAHEASAHDPVKTAIAVGATAISCAALAGSLLWVVASQKSTEAGLLQEQWQSAVSAFESQEGKSFKAISALADDILAMNRSRMLCAPQLAVVKDLVPDSIQLTRLGFSLITQRQEAAPSGAGEEAGGEESKRAARPKTIELAVLQLEGRAVSARPEIEVDGYIQALRASKVFSEQVDQIQLRSIARAPVAGEGVAGELPGAQFVIECQYKERK